MPTHPAHVAAIAASASASRARSVPPPNLAPLFARLKAKLQRRVREPPQHAIQVTSFATLPQCASPPLFALSESPSADGSEDAGSRRSQVDFSLEVRSAMSLLSRSIDRSMQKLSERLTQSEVATAAVADAARALQLADQQRAAANDDQFIRLQQQLLFERREGERREERIDALEAAILSLQQRLISAPVPSASALPSQQRVSSAQAQSAVASPAQSAAPTVQVPSRQSQAESATPVAPLSAQPPLRLDPAPACDAAPAGTASDVPARIVPGLKRVQSEQSLFDRLREEAEQSAGNLPPPRSQTHFAGAVSTPTGLQSVATAAGDSDSDNDDAPASRWSPQQRSISPPAVSAVTSHLLSAPNPSLSPPLIPMPVASPPSPSAPTATRSISSTPPPRRSNGSPQLPPPPAKAAGKSSTKATPRPVAASQSYPKKKKKARRRISFSQRYDDEESSEEEGTIGQASALE